MHGIIVAALDFIQQAPVAAGRKSHPGVGRAPSGALGLLLLYIYIYIYIDCAAASSVNTITLACAFSRVQGTPR